MGWLILCIIAFVVMFIFVPIKNLKYLWPSGIIGILVLIPIEIVFTALDAIKYYKYGSNILSIPLLYILSSFAGGILIANYYPEAKRLKFPYILLVSLMLLIMEILMLQFKYMSHGPKWGLIGAYILNVYGFTVMLWLSDWVGVFEKRKMKV